MNKVFAVIRREFIERVRTRAFVIGTVLVPLMGFVVGYLPQLLSDQESSTRPLVILNDAAGGLAHRMDSVLASQRIGADSIPRYRITILEAAGRGAALRDSVITQIGRRHGPPGAPIGVIVLTDQAIEEGKLSYFGADVTSFRNMNSLERTLEPMIRDERLARRNADSALKAAASIPLTLESKKVTEGELTGESGKASFILAYVVDMFMYVSLLLYGVQIMSSVIEEKANRVVEVLVSSLTPFQLLLGKVIGVGATGLLQLGIWSATGIYLTRIFGAHSGAGAMVEGGQAAAAGFTMPNITPDLVAVILVFFLLGFALYSGLYAAIGSMCSTQQEAQQASTPVTIIVVVGMISMFSLINEPSGSLARILTFIPFFTPLVIPVRYAIAPLPLGEVLLGAAVLVVGIVVVVWVGARIYRIGILSYGKRPTPAELWRWLKTS